MTKISEINLIQLPDQQVLVIENNLKGVNMMPQAIGESFAKIGSYLQELGETPTDIPFVMLPDYDKMTEDNIHMIIGFSVPKQLPSKGEIESRVIPSQKYLMSLYQGSDNDIAPLYEEMEQWAKDKGYVPVKTSIEFYYSGPEVPEAQQVTKVMIPLK